MTSSIPLIGSKGNAQPNLSRESHLTGLIGDGDFVRWSAYMGYHVYKGLDGHTPSDYIVDDGNGLLRVEVKRIEAVQHAHNNHYYVTATKLDTDRFDYIFVSTEVGCYWIPSSDCPKATLSIKVTGDDYVRNIQRPGKYEKYKVEMPR
jgi:hypothetical protein